MSVHVVALSGGKDSTALALRLAEVEPRDYVYVCTPTGNEPAAMFAHWRQLGDLLGSAACKSAGSVWRSQVSRVQDVMRRCSSS